MNVQKIPENIVLDDDDDVVYYTNELYYFDETYQKYFAANNFCRNELTYLFRSTNSNKVVDQERYFFHPSFVFNTFCKRSTCSYHIVPTRLNRVEILKWMPFKTFTPPFYCVYLAENRKNKIRRHISERKREG